MKVKELIKILEEVDPDFELEVYDGNSGQMLRIIDTDSRPEFSMFEIHAE